MSWCCAADQVRSPGGCPMAWTTWRRTTLITFKSHHDPLDDWALKELTGHYVNYRKQCSARDQPLLPEADFRLYAVCSRYPHNLVNHVTLEPVHQGVVRVRARHGQDPDHCGRSSVPGASKCTVAPVQCVS